MLKNHWRVANTSAGIYAMFFLKGLKKSCPLSSDQCFHGSRRDGMVEVGLYVSGVVFGTPRLSYVLRPLKEGDKQSQGSTSYALW